MADYSYPIADFLLESTPTIAGLTNAVISDLGYSDVLISYLFTGSTPEVDVTLTHVVFAFQDPLTVGEESTLDNLVATYTNPTAPIAAIRHFTLNSNKSVTSTEADVSGWVNIDLETDAYYRFELIANFSNNTASVAGPGFGFVFSDLPTNFGGLMYSMNTATTDTDRALVVNTVGANAVVSTADLVLPVTILGIFRANSTTGGTLKVRSSCGGGTSTLYGGSVLTVEKIS